MHKLYDCRLEKHPRYNAGIQIRFLGRGLRRGPCTRAHCARHSHRILLGLYCGVVGHFVSVAERRRQRGVWWDEAFWCCMTSARSEPPGPFGDFEPCAGELGSGQRLVPLWRSSLSAKHAATIVVYGEIRSVSLVIASATPPRNPGQKIFQRWSGGSRRHRAPRDNSAVQPAAPQ